MCFQFTHISNSVSKNYKIGNAKNSKLDLNAFTAVISSTVVRKVSQLQKKVHGKKHGKVRLVL